jgi:class 3 adenylate cyclase/pimeloyl-ACP methyl ester carboxylesterase
VQTVRVTTTRRMSQNPAVSDAGSLPVPPKTRYARSGDVSIAYQVVGDGPIDLVFVPGFVSHLDLQWTDRHVRSFFESLASFSRLILFDKRGTGLSDPVPDWPPLEQRMDDVRAVMDAAGSERAALLGLSEGGPMSALFAATYPERTAALIMCGTFACGHPDPSEPGAKRWQNAIAQVRAAADRWGEGASLAFFAPSIDSELVRERYSAFERAAASPGMARKLIDMVCEIDVRDILPSIRVPTLVLHRTDEGVPVELARAMASQIPGARMVELPGSDHIPFYGTGEGYPEEVEEFLTGARHHRPNADRMLATVVFTDIAGSTQRAAEVGDRRWRELLEEHDDLVRRELDRFRGRPIKTLGDGFLATFDGPERAIRCACSITSAVQSVDLSVRAGLHTGECEVLGDDLGGMAVNIGARVVSHANPDEVLVSSTVKDLVVGSNIQFEERGTHKLKGVPGEWRLYAALQE